MGGKVAQREEACNTHVPVARSPTMNTTLLAEARAAAARGWLVTTLRGKTPSTKAWTTAPQMSDGEINAAVYSGANIGVRTGGGLIVVDVDPGADPELLAFLSAIHTPTVRTGRDGRHFYFKGDARCSVGKISENVDVRGDGGQVVLPGSIHPDTGTPYTWIITPDEAPLAVLPPRIEALVTQSGRIRKAPTGKRNDTLNMATFMAAKAGAPTRELAHAAADVGLEHGEIVATINSATKAGTVYAPVFDQNEILVPGEHYFSTGEVVTMDQTAFIENCWDRIPKGVFFSRFGVTGEIKDGVFQGCENSRFRGIVSKFLPLCAWVKAGRVCEREYRNFSPDMGALVLAAGPDHVPNIEAITFYPIAGGSHPGWLVLDDTKAEPVTDHVSLWREVLCDVPFKDDNALFSYVAMLLTIYMRPKIQAPVPAFMLRATQERTGKTKLVTEFLAKILYGRDVAALAFGDDDAELDKRLAARNFSCHTVTFFDNIRGKIDSPVLCAYLTSPSYSARILGQSKNVEFHVKAVTVLTANNPSMTGEVAKRLIQIPLESKVDHPEFRTDFRHNPLGPYLESMRPKLLGSLQAIAEMTGPAFVMGGYEEWGRIVGGAMAGAGMALSQETFSEMTADADDYTSDIRALITSWSENFGSQPLTVDQVLSQVKGLGIMPRVLDAQTERAQSIRMGFALKDIQGRVFGDWKLTATGAGSRKQWRLIRVDGSRA